MKTEILTPKLETNKQNSFWYSGQNDIAKVSNEYRQVIVFSDGNIRVKFSDEDFFRKNEHAVDFALSLNLSDKNLSKLDFDECNWFDFGYKTSKMKNYEFIDGDEDFVYSKAIKNAQKYLSDDEFWSQF